jgi:hypothetical protein
MSCNRRREQNEGFLTLNKRELEREAIRRRRAGCVLFLICEDFGFIGDIRILDCRVIEVCNRRKTFDL